MATLLAANASCTFEERACATSCVRGTCYDGGRCVCYNGYHGANCNATELIDYFECGYKCTFDQGNCVVKSIQGLSRMWGCDCKPGYYGRTCSLFDCPNNCSWNGLCKAKDTCECYPGYFGPQCEHSCGCNGHGRCNADNTACIFDDGYKAGPNGTVAFECGCPVSDPTCTCLGPKFKACKSSCQWGHCDDGACVCWNGASGAACNVLSPRANANVPVGLNLAGVADWSTEVVFVDAMRTARDWVRQYSGDWFEQSRYAWSVDYPLNFTAEGYPSSLPPGHQVVTMMWRDVYGRAPAGRYTILYDGDGGTSPTPPASLHVPQRLH
jgi:hypothetical protein